jgi:hypothetical protein
VLRVGKLRARQAAGAKFPGRLRVALFEIMQQRLCLFLQVLETWVWG